MASRASVTIRDVAAEAGVSASTVSRVLSGGYASAATRQRVTAAVTALGFRPNHLARGLVRGESRTLGLVIPDITNPFFPALMRGVENKARQLGYAVVLTDSNEDVSQEEAVIQTLLDQKVDGLIVIMAGQGSERLPDLADRQFPLVVMDRRLSSRHVSSVSVDNVAGVRRAMEHLLAAGHRRIAYIGGVPNVCTEQDRFSGYVAALQAAGIGLDSSLVQAGYFTSAGGYEAMASLLAQQSKPTAVMAANDLMALGALKSAREHGIRVPEDISVIGFDDIPAAETAFPALTTVRQPVYELGARAAAMVIQQKQSSDTYRAQEVIFQPELMIRESTGPAR